MVDKTEMREVKMIGAGSAAIIVYDKSLKDFENSAFKEYLVSEGFRKWIPGHSYETTWIYININTKVYAKGMPGINVTRHIGNHAVTIDEFKVIYNIFKKYEGLSVLEMERK